MKVIFSHGKESGPWGSKIKALAQIAESQGYTVRSIDYTGISCADQRCTMLHDDLMASAEPYILVGSSMGGYVSLVASASEFIDCRGLFLLAPALYMPGYSEQEFTVSQKTEIVHGWADDVIPVENAIKFAQQHDCTLHLISGDHRLNSSLDEVKVLFEQFLKSLK